MASSTKYTNVNPGTQGIPRPPNARDRPFRGCLARYAAHLPPGGGKWNIWQAITTCPWQSLRGWKKTYREDRVSGWIADLEVVHNRGLI
jgi:hypothetical protein